MMCASLLGAEGTGQPLSLFAPREPTLLYGGWRCVRGSDAERAAMRKAGHTQ
ncbi:hypothetical protein HaLaN_05702, partial [Haematococcus lacustris]